MFEATAQKLAIAETPRETMNVVIVGHVDHGKSTLVGRLLADTGSLGEGKLEAVQEICRRSGKSFEYAFLLDALEEEQGQGITIDAARIFFKTEDRDYIIIDAPGHVEFLKNMVTGAARAEAAILLVDAKEGVRENSRRHGYLLSMLGIKQVVVAVNKIDLVNHSEQVFQEIQEEYSDFLSSVGITPLHYIPVSARDGDGIASASSKLSWFRGPTILEALDGLEKASHDDALPLRMPVQDVYKFNEVGDDRRLIAGRIESGTLRVGDDVVFLPSGKRSTIASLEVFSAEAPKALYAGNTASVTLEEQVFVSRGDVLCRPTQRPQVSDRLRVNLFWLGRKPMTPEKRYRLKLGATSVEVSIESIDRVLDASSLDATSTKELIERHDVAEVCLRTRQPIAFDLAAELESMGRFVIVDEYDIAGGGIVREALPASTTHDLQPGDLDLNTLRVRAFGHGPALVLLPAGELVAAQAVEAELVRGGSHAYLLDPPGEQVESVLGALLDSGALVISTTDRLAAIESCQVVLLAANTSPEEAARRVLEAVGSKS